jgi:hypothetical protein
MPSQVPSRSIPLISFSFSFSLSLSPYLPVRTSAESIIFFAGEIKWQEVELFQARLQNLKNNEDYGTSPQDQFDNLVLRGDILRLFVRIDRIKVRTFSVSLSLSSSFLCLKDVLCRESHELIDFLNV